MKPLLALFIVLGLASCAAPDSEILEQPLPTEAVAQEIAKAPAEEPASRPVRTNRLRIGDDILNLPDEAALRSSPEPTGNSDATIITRPPAE